MDYEGCPAYLKPIIATAIYTGLRKGEILNLKWKDVDLERGIIYVRENKQNHHQVKMVNDDLIDLFMKLPVKGEYLFHDEEGNPLRDVKRSFQTALRRAGIEDFRFHDLRHTFASRLAMAGKDLYLIQRLLGHREPRMVQRYAHHSVESLRNGIEVLETLKKEASERYRITILSQLGNLEESHANGS